MWHSSVQAADVSPQTGVAVISSLNVRPYVEAVEAISAGFRDAGADSVDVFDLQTYSGKSEDKLAQMLTEKGYRLCIAVGPQAALFASSTGRPFIYTVVLSPEDIPGLLETARCGISLRIPIRTQLAAIHGSLPHVRSVGLLFDREFNADFFSEARQAAGAYGLEIVPLEVSAKREIPKVLAQSWQRMDALWFIPDDTVISESETVIQYINREALLNGVPTIGFNRFFYEAGSLLSFVFDYTDLGRQTAVLALETLNKETCVGAPPRYSIWINERVANRLGIQVRAEDAAPEGGAP